MPWDAPISRGIAARGAIRWLSGMMGRFFRKRAVRGSGGLERELERWLREQGLSPWGPEA